MDEIDRELRAITISDKAMRLLKHWVALQVAARRTFIRRIQEEPYMPEDLKHQLYVDLVCQNDDDLAASLSRMDKEMLELIAYATVLMLGEKEQ